MEDIYYDKLRIDFIPENLFLLFDIEAHDVKRAGASIPNAPRCSTYDCFLV